MSLESLQWRLARRPSGDIGEGDLALQRKALPELRQGEIRVRTIYLSLDPTNRIWMSDIDQYMPPVQIGDVMRGLTIGVVEASANPDYRQGELVSGAWGWQSRANIGTAERVAKIRPMAGVPLSAFQGLFGMIGCTAYFGMLDIGQPKAGETVVVTAAAGAVGSIAGQLAKIAGARVVGIAGSAEKCRWITEELGFDAAIDYRKEDVAAALGRHCPDGIDVDFENVGGPHLDDILARINIGARIALCGLIATYNADGPVPGPYLFRNILMKRATVKGFIVSDYAKRFPEANRDLAKWYGEGKLKYRVDIVDGLENAPTALRKLFDGSNNGKLMVRVSPEPA